MFAQALAIVFVTAFLAIVIFGHVLLLEAMLYRWLQKRYGSYGQPASPLVEADSAEHALRSDQLAA